MRRFILAILLAISGAGVASAQDAVVKRETFSRFVFRDTRTAIFKSFALQADCLTVRGFNVRVDRLPKNGTVELRKETVVVDRTFFDVPFQLDSEMAANITRCQGKNVPVIMVYYTSKPGYSGFDDMELVVTAADRRLQRVQEFKIGVR
jgi:hypothetical protein